MKATTTTNPFETLSANVSVTTNNRRLDHTALLNGRAIERATETIKSASANPELHELATKMMAGDPADLMELFEKTGALENVADDALLLDGASDDELKRLLESRRSDRSKCKKKGIGSNMLTCRNYVAAMYAELMVREAMGKPYTGSRGAAASEFNAEQADVEAIGRRVKSLQTKKCRIKKLAEAGVEGAAEELASVEAEIARLNELRGARVVSHTAIKSVKADELRAALADFDTSGLPEEMQALLAKLG